MPDKPKPLYEVREAGVMQSPAQPALDLQATTRWEDGVPVIYFNTLNAYNAEAYFPGRAVFPKDLSFIIDKPRKMKFFGPAGVMLHELVHVQQLQELQRQPTIVEAPKLEREAYGTKVPEWNELVESGKETAKREEARYRGQYKEPR